MNVCIKLLWNGNIKIIHNEHFFDLLLKTLFSIPYTTLYTHYMLEFTKRKFISIANVFVLRMEWKNQKKIT